MVRAASISSRARHWQPELWWGLYCEYLLCLAGQPLRRVPVWECQFFVVRWQVGLPPIGGALLASAGEFAIYQHNQPLPVVVMSLVVVWVWL